VSYLLHLFGVMLSDTIEERVAQGDPGDAY
jgi:hypothetical protein